MPQIVSVPGQGDVEFPDGMTDDQIVAAIKANSQPQTFTGELGRQLGLTARAAIKSVAALPNMVADPFVGLYNRFRPTTLSDLVAPSQAPSFSQRLDQTLTNWGLPEPKNALERVVQSGATALGPVGVSGLVSKAAPILAPLGQNLGWQAISSMLGGGASQAAAEGGAGPGGQLAAGLLGGIAGPGALSLGKAMGSAALRVPGSLLAPFTEAGRTGIAAQAFQKAATDARSAADNIQAAPALVPGVRPTTAELADDTGISALYKALINRQGAPFTDRASANDAARQAFLTSSFGGPADVAAAKSARDVVTGPMRDAAFANAAPVDTAPIVVAGQKVLDSGAKYRGSGPLLQKFVNDISQISDPQVLYNGPRKAINDALAGQVSKDSPLAQFTKAELIGLKGNIDDLIEQSAPGFKDYMRTHADLSRPIDARQLGQDITAASINPQTDQLSVAKFTRQMANRSQDVANSGQVTSDALSRVNQDLKRSAAPLNATRTPGSDTAQNLVGNAMLNGLLGRIPLGPIGSITSKVGSALYSPMETKTQQLVMNGMLDPRLGAQLLRRPIPQKPDLVAQFFSSLFPISYGGLLGTGSNQ